MEQACEDAKRRAGGPGALARALEELGEKITPQAVSLWKIVPPKQVLKVEAITGISKHELRPDIFGPAHSDIASLA
jgi:DNA-binding transcriptional regulator YdaS (Cro superfamily)